MPNKETQKLWFVADEEGLKQKHFVAVAKEREAAERLAKEYGQRYYIYHLPIGEVLD